MGEKVTTFRERITQQENYSAAYRTDDEFLLKFLHCAKFDMEKATTRFFHYYETLLRIPNIDLLLNGDTDYLSAAIKKTSFRRLSSKVLRIGLTQTWNNVNRNAFCRR